MNTRRRILLANASIATSEEVRQGTLLIEDGIIREIWKPGDDGMTMFEGIETEEQLKYLKASGFKYGQGFLFDKPLNVEEFEKKYL